MPSLADVVEKLCTAFASRLARPTVIGVVRRCRRELEILTGPTRLEAIDRLARRRLTALANARDAALNASPRRFGHPHGDAP